MLLDYTRANEQREITKEIIEKKQQVTIFYDKFIHVYGNIICIISWFELIMSSFIPVHLIKQKIDKKYIHYINNSYTCNLTYLAKKVKENNLFDRIKFY